MSVYDKDDRVDCYGGVYHVEMPGIAGVAGSIDGRVQPSHGGGFEAFLATDDPQWRRLKTFDTADEAIRSLIGNPQ